MYKLCIVDDEFSKQILTDVKERDPYREYSIRKAFDSEYWTDANLKTLLLALFDESSFDLIAYSNPEFIEYDNDVVIFDWDYGPMLHPSKDYLKNILEHNSCMIYIYTGCDREFEIKAIINSLGNEYSNRLCLFDKNESSNISIIIDKLKQLKRENFAFRFGSTIRQKSKIAIEDILVNLGKFDMEEVWKLIHSPNKDVRELTEFIGEKFKALLIGDLYDDIFRDEPSLPEMTAIEDSTCLEDGRETSTPQSSLESLWRYRLYSISDKHSNIRKGEILSIDSKLYLVITPDCELSRFWKKTLGILSIIPLYDVVLDKTYIKDLYKYHKITPSSISITSLSNPINNIPGTPLCLPFVTATSTYLLFPKMITWKFVNLPIDQSLNYKNLKLDIKHIPNSQKVASINEPFLSAVIEHIISSLSGYGTPDYDDNTNILIKSKVQSIFL